MSDLGTYLPQWQPGITFLTTAKMLLLCLFLASSSALHGRYDTFFPKNIQLLDPGTSRPSGGPLASFERPTPFDHPAAPQRVSFPGRRNRFRRAQPAPYHPRPPLALSAKPSPWLEDTYGLLPDAFDRYRQEFPYDQRRPNYNYYGRRRPPARGIMEASYAPPQPMGEPLYSGRFYDRRPPHPRSRRFQPEPWTAYPRQGDQYFDPYDTRSDNRDFLQERGRQRPTSLDIVQQQRMYEPMRRPRRQNMGFDTVINARRGEPRYNVYGGSQDERPPEYRREPTIYQAMRIPMPTPQQRRWQREPRVPPPEDERDPRIPPPPPQGSDTYGFFDPRREYDDRPNGYRRGAPRQPRPPPRPSVAYPNAGGADTYGFFQANVLTNVPTIYRIMRMPRPNRPVQPKPRRPKNVPLVQRPGEWVNDKRAPEVTPRQQRLRRDSRGQHAYYEAAEPEISMKNTGSYGKVKDAKPMGSPTEIFRDEYYYDREYGIPDRPYNGKYVDANVQEVEDDEDEDEEDDEDKDTGVYVSRPPDFGDPPSSGSYGWDSGSDSGSGSSSGDTPSGYSTYSSSSPSSSYDSSGSGGSTKSSYSSTSSSGDDGASFGWSSPSTDSSNDDNDGDRKTTAMKLRGKAPLQVEAIPVLAREVAALYPPADILTRAAPSERRKTPSGADAYGWFEEVVPSISNRKVERSSLTKPKILPPGQRPILPSEIMCGSDTFGILEMPKFHVPRRRRRMRAQSSPYVVRKRMETAFFAKSSARKFKVNKEQTKSDDLSGPQIFTRKYQAVRSPEQDGAAKETGSSSDEMPAPPLHQTSRKEEEVKAGRKREQDGPVSSGAPEVKKFRLFTDKKDPPIPSFIRRGFEEESTPKKKTQTKPVASVASAASFYERNAKSKAAVWESASYGFSDLHPRQRQNNANDHFQVAKRYQSAVSKPHFDQDLGAAMAENTSQPERTKTSQNKQTNVSSSSSKTLSSVSVPEAKREALEVDKEDSPKEVRVPDEHVSLGSDSSNRGHTRGVETAKNLDLDEWKEADQSKAEVKTIRKSLLRVRVHFEK